MSLYFISPFASDGLESAYPSFFSSLSDGLESAYPSFFSKPSDSEEKKDGYADSKPSDSEEKKDGYADSKPSDAKGEIKYKDIAKNKDTSYDKSNQEDNQK